MFVSRPKPEDEKVAAKGESSPNSEAQPAARGGKERSFTAQPKVPQPATDATAKTKLSERKESMSIKDLEKFGIVVEAEQKGKNSASGKVRVTTSCGAVLEAERVKMSAGGMLVAEGNPVAVKGEMRVNMAGENGALAIYYDEEKQAVIVRAAPADKVASDDFGDDSGTIDPDRGMLAPDPDTSE